VYRTKWQLHHEDVVPFRKAVNGGLKMIMLSHAIYPKDGGRRPASLNRYIATKRLRRELDFKGVAISDALEPASWWYGGDVPRTCRATIRAGVDIALITGDVYTARDCAEQIVRGVKSGSISEFRIDQAVRRVLELKTWLRLIP
jgi:beta-N-acetylhexosaminidase